MALEKIPCENHNCIKLVNTLLEEKLKTEENEGNKYELRQNIEMIKMYFTIYNPNAFEENNISLASYYRQGVRRHLIQLEHYFKEGIVIDRRDIEPDFN